ncbi:hypothetical protein LOK49_LG06G00130 [Camellia lanceoleosa]|uniref:Uncharacterized protein n=1 Tax=Camellia lanceoleosa TaxID=1840588 RepID=A0ACC0HGE0_9ERIC|nr:hypothetical protein LOK49_LG06G00130 [Camellia lanceoleosa]
MLPLVPLIKANLIKSKNIIIDAKSGVSGAGRGANEANLYTEIAEGIHSYGITGHRHVPEIEQGLSEAANFEVTVRFTPHLMPISRVWCRRTDELVDGINGWSTTPEVLDKWEQRLFDLFHGRPPDLYDAALFHTITNYPIDIQLFKDFIEGMRMDLKKSRYENFDELYLYSYHVAGTVALMGVQLMGTSPDSKASPESVYHSALSFAIATQLTDILRDIGEE